MMIAQILAFSLHLNLYQIVITATSVQDLENKLNHISLSEQYSQSCHREWTHRRFPKNCILLIETAARWKKQPPQKLRTSVRDYCKHQVQLDKSHNVSYGMNMILILKQDLLHYPECHHKLQEYLLDKQYKFKKERLYQETS